MAALDRIVTRTGLNRTDCLNRATQVYDLVLDLMEKGGGRIQVVNPDGTREAVTIL